jgi:metallo-beta-lactamase family protein
VSEKLSITFCSGAGTATGANFLLETEKADGPKFLIDCGLLQGPKVAEDKNREPFPYDPKSIDALFVTHAHLDHIGRIPQLVKDGFRGKIYSTAPTKEIAKLSLIDSLGVLEKEARNHGQPLLYGEREVDQALALWEAHEYHDEIKISDFTVVIRDAGHILGSAMYEFQYKGKKILFTGDLGNSPAPLLRDTELVHDVDYLIIESVYGDRNHEDRSARREKLEDLIENVMRENGTLVIPAFSIERTQEMLYEIERMMEESRIPLVPVYIDSPLAIGVTSVYKKYAKSHLNENVAPVIAGEGGIFAFPQLHQTLSTQESRAIAGEDGRKIIIAGSGMSNGGRVIHHEKRYLPDAKNALLLAGYQAAGSLGRQMQDGARNVNILGDTIPVRARVVTISGYSAHKDAQHLLEFVQATADTVKKVFVVLGEPKSSLALVQKIRDYLVLDARAPSPGEKVILDI